MAAGRFSKAELLAHRGAVVDDLIGPGNKLLFVGINPGLWTAAAHAHFARPGNRFWPALHAAGLTPTVVDASAGMPEDARRQLLAIGVGISNIVPIATARADELTRPQLREGGRRLARRVEHIGPKVVAVLGLTAYRQAFDLPATRVGRQPHDLAGADLWVLPNPSGLNAHETIGTLGRAYREAAVAAGVIRG
ncbi:MAG: Uracil-DNA glycosylase superfamily [Ilumatobacteraceae bacterium]|nr:Uracil-DNA glycosylase superfamily [Ilumatobacteraceae bacterium]